MSDLYPPAPWATPPTRAEIDAPESAPAAGTLPETDPRRAAPAARDAAEAELPAAPLPASPPLPAPPPEAPRATPRSPKVPSWTAAVLVLDPGNAAFVHGHRATLPAARLGWGWLLAVVPMLVGLVVLGAPLAAARVAFANTFNCLTVLELALGVAWIVAGARALVGILRRWRRWTRLQREGQLVQGTVTESAIITVPGPRVPGPRGRLGGNGSRSTLLQVTVAFPSPVSGRSLEDSQTIAVPPGTVAPGRLVAVLYRSDADYAVL